MRPSSRWSPSSPRRRRRVCARPSGLLNRSLLQRIDDEGEELVASSARLFASDEAQEGMRAFRERRLPLVGADQLTPSPA